VVTYCENRAPSGAIVSYGFDEERGEVSDPLDKTESWFADYGDSKGISFNADGTKIFVTFESDKTRTILGRIHKFRKRIVGKGLFGQFTKVVETPLTPDAISTKKPKKNGIAAFSIDAEGKIAREPDRIIVKSDFCRFENIDICDRICVVTDVVNHSFAVYDLSCDPKFKKPIQTVSLGKAAPHGAKFSPDGRLLVISCLGVRVVNQKIHWQAWESPREDKVFIFERAS
jgi:hypothetical protein